MKRYIVFAGNNYYPGGGACDYTGHSFEDKEAAKEAGLKCLARDGNDWVHIFDAIDERIVWEDAK